MRLLLWCLLVGCTADAALPAPSSSDSPFELVLHAPMGRSGPDEACETRLCTSLLELIEGARHTIDFAWYGLRRQPRILSALTHAQARGVRVRGVVDRTTDGRNHYDDTDALADALGTVHDDLISDRHTADQRAARPFSPSRCWLPRPPGSQGPLQCVGYDLGDTCLLGAFASAEPLSFQGDIMHHKFTVVDGEHVWMGSTNVSDTGTGGYNANVVGVWHDTRIASAYTAEFEQLHAGRFHGDKRSIARAPVALGDRMVAETWFSPQDRPLSRAVRPHLRAARERIDVAIFFLTDKGVTAELIAAHQRGVRVRVLMDGTAARNEYAKHELARSAGIHLKVESWGGKLHAKAAAIDGQTLVLGSMNWTRAGEWGNDENTIVLRSAAHALAFHEWFDTLWASVPDRWLQGAPDPESHDSPPSCVDGTDNDYDTLSDGADPGCGLSPPARPRPPAPRVIAKGTPDAEGTLVKGISLAHDRTYLVPGHPAYAAQGMPAGSAHRWFCSERDARDAGYRPARRR